jgi:hypothetical protein
MHFLKNRDVVSGLVFMGIGLGALIKTHFNYPVGSVTFMGPGFFPMMLGVGLLAIGLITSMVAWGDCRQRWQPQFGWRAVLAVLGAMLAFALLVERAGLLPATMALSLIVGMARVPYSFKSSLLLGMSLSALSWLVFVLGLNMNLRMLAWGG